MVDQCTQLLNDASPIIFLFGALFGALAVGIVTAIVFATVRP